MEKPRNPQEYNSPGWFFVAISRAGFGAAGVDPTEPLALDIILDRRDLAGGPSVTGLAGAGAAPGLSQSSSKSPMSKSSRSRSGSFVPGLFPAGAVL